jgi:hypothetical protein
MGSCSILISDNHSGPVSIKPLAGKRKRDFTEINSTQMEKTL